MKRPRLDRFPMMIPEEYVEAAKARHKPPPKVAALLQAPEDTKRLRTLVRKYGAAVVAHAAGIIDLPRGRPASSLLHFERMGLAQLIDDFAEERREDGSTTPIKDAYYWLYDSEFSKEEQAKLKQPADHFEAWKKPIKKMLAQGRKELQSLERTRKNRKS